MNYFWCKCGGEVAAGGDAQDGGGECLTCHRVFASTAELLGAGGSAAQFCNRGRRGRPARCQVPGCTNDMVALCDEPIAGRRTCDQRMCSRHRTIVGRNRDRCPAHTRKELVR